MKRVLSLILAIIMMPVISLAYNARPSELTGFMDGILMAKTVAEEGMVLLENKEVDGEKALPLKKGESIAVFGINQIDFIYGGGGSGNFNSQNDKVGYVSLYDALLKKESNGDITLYHDLINSYKDYYNDYWTTDKRTYAYGTKQGAVIKFRGEMEISREAVNNAASSCDTAIITIGRPAGEDGDRANAEGDFKLGSKEKNMIEYVKSAGFKKVIVILNVTGVIESDWLKDGGIDAVLMVSLPGMVGGDAMADVLLGESYPSGKLVDTWAGNYTDYPSSSNFGNSSYTNYKEDIFVGYRYFETIPGAKEKVNYPFGFGLSYADFLLSDARIEVLGTGRDRSVTATVTVTNKGENPGKEVIQLYKKSPETTLTQTNRDLIGFYKTKELKKGESEVVKITVDFDSLSSYDDMGKSGFEAAYVLEKGEYEFYLGNSVRCDKAGTYTLYETECVRQLTHQMVPDTSKFNERLTSSGSYEKIEQKENAPILENDVDEKYKAVYENEKAKENEDGFITFNDLARAFADGESEEDTRLLEAFTARLTVDEAIKLTGCTTPVSNMGHRTGIGGLEVYNLPIIGTSNGPAGIQYNGSKSTWETTSTFYPCATMQASTWNEELIEQLGAAMGDEARYFGMSLWQAPGMNIHRDPLCGRNFEYFAEDPFVTGKIGAAITKGVQSRKFASQLKHFAFNNQENGRWGNDSRISERAIREIYLKGFEIAVKEAKPWSVMSSYNRINGTQTSGSYSLLTAVLRNEWGFDGFVMTDFRTRNVSHSQEIFAGNDLKAPADSPRPDEVKSAVNSGALPMWKVRRSAERIIRFALKTEDAERIANEDFKYDVKISVNSSKVSVLDSKVKLKENITWGEFLNSITSTYAQTFVLTDNLGNIIEDENTDLKVGMKIVVTAEDNVTTKTFDVTGESLALKKNAKASYTESGHSASNAVDGNYETRWSGFSSNYVWNDWIEVDLGDEYHITGVEVSYYKGEEREYSYELRIAEKDAAEYWSDTKKNRDFDSQGYKLIKSDKASYVQTQSDKVNEYGRFLNLKLTDGVGAFGPTLWEIEVFGWKLCSNEYKIDEENKIIYVTQGDTTSDAVAKMEILGMAEIEFVGENDTWVNEGEKFVVTDTNGEKTEYTVKEREAEEGEEGHIFEGVIGAVATYEENSKNSADKVIDNDLGTRWSAYNSGVNQAICIDLGAEKSITGVSSYWYGDGRESTYNIYITNTPTILNGTFLFPAWYKKENLTSKGSSDASIETYDEVYAKGRYVTIYTTQNTNNVVSLWEVDVFVSEKEVEDIYCNVTEDKIEVVSNLENAIVAVYGDDVLLKAAVINKGTFTIENSVDIKKVKIFSFYDFVSMKPALEVKEIAVVQETIY